MPKALDMLVLELLQLDRDARPANAAEVLERLLALDSSIADEELRTPAAYLMTPPLVGRDVELERIRRRIERAPTEAAQSVIVEGAPGLGRTRIIDASVLRATLAGHTAVRCDAYDAQSGDYGVARALARQLFELVPVEAAEAATTFQAALAGIVSQSDSAITLGRAELQQALQGWLLALHRRRRLVLAVDDVHRIDEPSASMLALLADSMSEARPLLLLSAEAGAAWSAPTARKLLDGALVLKLCNLSEAECDKLLRSLFGEDTPNLALLAARTYPLCSGNPGDLLRLVQHLIDRGVIHYAFGAWTLPAEIDSSDLPESLAQALAARIAGLDAPARRLSQVLALCPDGGLSLDECASVCGELNRMQLMAAGEQLSIAEIALQVSDRLTLTQPSWVPLLRSTLSRAEELTLQAALANMLERRPDGEVRAAQHWLRAGCEQRAVELLVTHSASSQEKTARSPELFASYLRSLPSGSYETFERAIRACHELNRPKKDEFVLLSRLSGILPMLNTFAPAHTMRLLARLKHDSGLEDWEALVDETDPKQRLMKALARARARYEATPEHERVNDPLAAIQQLTRAVVGAGGSVMISLDLQHLRSWPQLQPLVTLSPAIQAASKLMEGIDARLAGRNPHASKVYLELLSMMQQPDRAGMDPSHAGYVALGVMNGLGVLEAMTGNDHCLAWAERISVNPSYQVNAMLIRMLHHLWDGDVASADQAKKAAERLRIQNVGRPMYEGQHLIGEVQAFATSGDLTRMRHARDEIIPLAKRHAAWLPVLGYARAEYARLAGNPHKALQHIQHVLRLAPCGMHQIWPAAASAHIDALLALDRTQTALEYAEHCVQLAHQELGYEPEVVSLARALARARAGQSDAAELAEEVIRRMRETGFGKLHLGHAHEVRARIALLTGDGAAFEEHAHNSRKLLSVHRNAALTAKCQRLLQDGARTFGTRNVALALDSASDYSSSRVELALASCGDAEQRARLALNILLSQSRASAGCLFTFQEQNATCAAHSGEFQVPDAWYRCVAEYIEYQRQPAVTQTQTSADEHIALWVDSEGHEFRPILLCHNDAGTLFITGVAALRNSDDLALGRSGEAAAIISRYFASSGAPTLATLIE